MAKNNPSPKNTPTAKPIAPQVKQSSTVKNIATSNTSESWFKLPKSQNDTLLFDKTNYILMAVAGFLVILGFILMAGGNTDAAVFNEAEIYSTRRITIAPITVVLGFIVLIVAILKKPATTLTEA